MFKLCIIHIYTLLKVASFFYTCYKNNTAIKIIIWSPSTGQYSVFKKAQFIFPCAKNTKKLQGGSYAEIFLFLANSLPGIFSALLFVQCVCHISSNISALYLHYRQYPKCKYMKLYGIFRKYMFYLFRKGMYYIWDY